MTNRHRSRAVRVIGARASCDKSGCVTVKSALPLTIPPMQAVELEVEYRAMGLGRCDKELPIYTDSPGQAELRLLLVCEVFAAGEAAHHGGAP
jgi:hypothetical protein